MYKLITAFALLVLFTVSVFAADRVILVGSGAPDPIDAKIIEHLKKLGFTVEPHAHDEKHPVNLNGVALVFISESTSSANITGAYKDSTVPVVNCETWTYDDMGFAPNDTGFSSDPGDTLTILKGDHPITKGLPKKVKVYSSAISIMAANNLAGELTILAVRADDEGRVTMSVYEKGAKTATGQTKACHVNIYAHSTAWEVITTDGWKLIENSILYASGRILAVEPSGKLATTWAGIKNQRGISQ